MGRSDFVDTACIVHTGERKPPKRAIGLKVVRGRRPDRCVVHEEDGRILASLERLVNIVKYITSLNTGKQRYFYSLRVPVLVTARSLPVEVVLALGAEVGIHRPVVFT